MVFHIVKCQSALYLSKEITNEKKTGEFLSRDETNVNSRARNVNGTIVYKREMILN